MALNGVHHWRCPHHNEKFYSAQSVVEHFADDHNTDISWSFDQPVPDDWLDSLTDDEDRSLQAGSDQP